MSFLKRILLFILLIGVIKCAAQSDNENGKFGFLLKSNINVFQSNDLYINPKMDIGLGLGYIYSKNINHLLALDLEAQVNFEKHKLIYNNLNLKVNDINVAVPLKLRFNLYKDFSLMSGVQYLYVLSNQKEELKFRKNNYLSLIGTSYSIKYKYFTVIPEISYSLGLNNSLKQSNTNNHELKRSAISFGIKIM